MVGRHEVGRERDRKSRIAFFTGNDREARKKRNPNREGQRAKRADAREGWPKQGQGFRDLAGLLSTADGKRKRHRPRAYM